MPYATLLCISFDTIRNMENMTETLNRHFISFLLLFFKIGVDYKEKERVWISLRLT